MGITRRGHSWYSHLIPTISPRGDGPSFCDFDSHLYITGDEPEAQKAHVTCPRSPTSIRQDIHL